MILPLLPLLIPGWGGGAVSFPPPAKAITVGRTSWCTVREPAG